MTTTLTPTLRRKARALRPLLLTAATLSALTSGVANAQGRADTIFRFNERTNKTVSVSCTIKTDGLEKVEFTRSGGKDASFDSAEVIQVVWGDVPTSFTDGQTYAKRGDWESAVQNFQAAAGDDDAREPVRAAARLRAIEAMIGWGSTDAARFADAVSEADRFLADHSDSRSLPQVRSLKARAAWLGGDAAAARDGYRALYEAGKAGTAGYSNLLTAHAAMQGGRAALAAGDGATGREMFDLASAAYGKVESEDAVIAATAAAGVEVANMGAAMAQLSNDATAARQAFERALKSAKTSAGKGAARLGLGQALLAEGKAREAEGHFAWVASLDHTSADRRADALVGLAEAGAQLNPDDTAAAKRALNRVSSLYGDTPAAARAAELLRSM